MQGEGDRIRRVTSTPQRTPTGLCAMCFTRKPLAHGWAWLKLCEECAAKHGANPGASSDRTEAPATPPREPPDQ